MTQIPYPAIETLLAKYGADAIGRARARVALENDMVASARRAATFAGRSLRCQTGDHARVDPEYGRVGCLNDGSRCICECHDPTEDVA